MKKNRTRKAILSLLNLEESETQIDAQEESSALKKIITKLKKTIKIKQK